MEALLAGGVAGQAMGVVLVALFADRALSLSAPIRRAQSRFPEGTSLPLLTAGLALLVQASWALLGVGLGAIYWGVRGDAADGLGSPAWGYTLAMIGAGALAAGAATMVQPSWWRRAALAALAFVALFGWLLPHLGQG